MNLRRLLTYLSGPVLALFFLWLSFRDVDIAQLMEQLKSARWGYLAIYICSVPLHLFVRAWRWRALLEPVRPRLPLRELFAATCIGYMALLLPGRVGEVLRPALLNRRTAVPLAPTLATVGVERAVLDVVAVLFCGAIALVLPSSLSGLGDQTDPHWLVWLQGVGAVLLGGGLASLAVVYSLGRHRKAIAAWLENRKARLPGRFLPVVVNWFASLLPGLAAVGTLGGLLRIAWRTAVVWLVIAVGMHAGIVACGIDLPPAGVLIMLPILALGISLPTPGGTGTFHLAMKLGLVSLFGVDEAAALGAGLVVHAFNWLPMLGFGGYFIARGGLERPAGGEENSGPSAADLRP
jgi:uncharacterized membrane protein YbhN (UPF0104 family)